MDDAISGHPKILSFGKKAAREALGLYLETMCYAASQLTDGFVPDAALHCSAKWKAQMIDAGLWEEFKGGILVHDYLDYNPTREQVMEQRSANTGRQQDWRQRNAPNNAVVTPLRNGPVTPAPYTSPVPPKTEATTTATTAANAAATPPVDKPKRPPTALYLLYEAVKHDLWGRDGKPDDRQAERRDYDGLKSLRIAWKDHDIIAAAKELRRQVDDGLIPDWKAGARFGSFALRTKFDAGTWWMDKLLADLRRNEEHQPKKPALRMIGDAMRKAGIQ